MTGRGAEIAARLRNLVGEICGVDPARVEPAGHLRGYGLDSVRVTELVLLIEEEFQVQLRLEELSGIDTLADLALQLERLLPDRTAGPARAASDSP